MGRKAKLRHFAITTADPQKTAEFYEGSEGYVSTWAGEGKDE